MKKTTHHHFRVVLSAGLLISAGALSAQSLYTAGHGDLGLGEGAEVEPHVHLHTGAIVNGAALTEDQEFAPEQLLVFVPDSTYNYFADNGGRQSGSAWDPLGISLGESLWFLPQSHDIAHDTGAPFFGIGAEEVLLGAFDGDTLTLTLTGASMPAGASFSIWTNDGFGPNFYMSTVDGIDGSDAIDVAANSHGHYNFGFTQAGLYNLDFEVSALEGGIPVTASATYSFLVSVPEPSSAAALFGLLSMGLVFLRRRR